MSSQKEDIDADPSRQLDSTKILQIDQQQRFYKVYADIGDLILLIITGEVFRKFIDRAAVIGTGILIPAQGFVSLPVVAALFGLKDDGARALLKRNNVPFKKPGQDQLYRLADLIEKFEKTDEV